MSQSFLLMSKIELFKFNSGVIYSVGLQQCNAVDQTLLMMARELSLVFVLSDVKTIVSYK